MCPSAVTIAAGQARPKAASPDLRCVAAAAARAQQGFFAVERTCHACHGMGQVIADPCRSCGGEGRVQQNKVLSVSVPAGVDTGTRIRLSGKGEAGLRVASRVTSIFSSALIHIRSWIATVPIS